MQLVTKIINRIRETHNLYDFRVLNLDELNEDANGLEEIKNRVFDGILVKDFLSESEVEVLLNGFNNLKEPEYVKTPVGWVFPAVFQQLFSMTENTSSEECQTELIIAL
jgi:hypothetical protein